VSHPARGPVGDGGRRSGDRRRPPKPTTVMHGGRHEAAFVSHPAIVHSVTPANAGVQRRTVHRPPADWIPACAGMTGVATLPAGSSFPDIAHSVTPANAGVQRRTVHRPPADWIPACAGVTGVRSRAGRISPQGVIRRGRGWTAVGLRDSGADPTYGTVHTRHSSASWNPVRRWPARRPLLDPSGRWGDGTRNAGSRRSSGLRHSAMRANSARP
jgi:hypothetical protein